MKTYTLMAILILASMVLSACQLGSSTPAPATSAPATSVPATATPAATQTATLQPASPTATSAPTQSVVVVTATGVQDLGTLLGNQPMTPVVTGKINWDDLLKIADWREDKGLTGAQVLYAQSSVPGTIELPLLAGQTTFTVPQGSVLVFGAYKAEVNLGNGKKFSYSNGFYSAFTEGTVIKSLTIENGFLLIAKNADAQAEYCARIAQGANEKWAMDHLFRPASWQDPVCSGVISTVIDTGD